MILALLVGCNQGVLVSPGRIPFPDTGGVGEPRTVQAVLSDPCAVCHSGVQAAGQLNLELQPWNNLVNQRAAGNPGMFRVVPFDPEASYLLHKVRGTHLEVGGTGQSMPPSGYDPLLSDQLALLEDWIESGAEPFP